MLQYLINVTDNTFISTVIFAQLCALIVKLNKPKAYRIIISGFIIGLTIALTYAILKSNTGFAVREFYDLGIITPLAILLIPLLVVLWMAFASAKSYWHTLFIALSMIVLALITAKSVPNLMLFPLEFNVGMESIFNNEYLFKWVGYLFAISVMLLVGAFVYQICCRLSDQFSFLVITLSLLIFAIQNSINIIQILIVRRLISYNQWMMDLVIFILSHINFFTYIYLVIILFLSISLYLKSKTASLVGSNPAQIRKIKAQLRNDRRKSLLILAGAAITAYTITRARYIFEQGVELSPADPVSINADGLIVIPLENVNDGNLHRYGYETSDGTIVRFIVIKKSENSYGVGLDACDICGATGYYQRGDKVVCILCDVVMNIATIGFAGGCNPVPLQFEIIQGSMVIKPTDLEAEKTRFQ